MAMHTLDSSMPNTCACPVTPPPPPCFHTPSLLLSQYDKSVRTVLQHITLTFPGKTDNNVIKSRQRSAFAPNYVHSLDSSHMMKTAIACKQQGARDG